MIKRFTAKTRSQKCAVSIGIVKNNSDFKKPVTFVSSSTPSEHGASDDFQVVISSSPISPSLSFSDIRWTAPMNEQFDAGVKEIQLNTDQL